MHVLLSFSGALPPLLSPSWLPSPPQPLSSTPRFPSLGLHPQMTGFFVFCFCFCSAVYQLSPPPFPSSPFTPKTHTPNTHTYMKNPLNPKPPKTPTTRDEGRGTREEEGYRARFLARRGREGNEARTWREKGKRGRGREACLGGEGGRNDGKNIYIYM